MNCGEKARVVAAATISVILEGPVRAFLQVAEYRQLAQKASFTTLSGTLGQIVIQLHTGILLWLHLPSGHALSLPSKLRLYIWQLARRYKLDGNQSPI